MNKIITTIIPLALLGLSGTVASTSCQKVTPKTEMAANDEFVKESDKASIPATYVPEKANLPIINGNTVIYRNADNDVVTVTSDRSEDHAFTMTLTSLYKGILKHSTNESPNITNPEKFYADVQKNIPKNFTEKGLYHDIEEIIPLKSQQASYLFTQLYDKYTAPDSPGGKEIVSEEITYMMDAWSSTGIVK